MNLNLDGAVAKCCDGRQSWVNGRQIWVTSDSKLNCDGYSRLCHSYLARACCDTSYQLFLHETYSWSLDSLSFHLHGDIWAANRLLYRDVVAQAISHTISRMKTFFRVSIAVVLIIIFSCCYNHFCPCKQFWHQKVNLVDCNEKCWCLVLLLK